MRLQIVLIPLNSGLVFTSIENWKDIYCLGLNPFEFRAGIYLQRQVCMSVPLLS